MFPERNLDQQYISSSFQDIVQQYLTGSNLYFLNGYGNEILNIPSSSIGYTIITSDITASMSVNSSSYSLLSNNSISSSYAPSNIIISSSYSTTSSFAQTILQQATASYSISASIAQTVPIQPTSSYSTTSSFAQTILQQATASYAITSSYSLTASYSTNSISLNGQPDTYYLRRMYMLY
jgi:hypothetical protein